MALTEQVIMPGVDYQAICDAVRTRTGGTDLLKSGDIASAIASIPEGAQATNGTFSFTTKTTALNGYTIPCSFVPKFLIITQQQYTKTASDGTVTANASYTHEGGIITFIYNNSPVCVKFAGYSSGTIYYSNFTNFSMSLSSGKLKLNCSETVNTRPTGTARNISPFFGAEPASTADTHSYYTVYRWAAIG